MYNLYPTKLFYCKIKAPLNATVRQQKLYLKTDDL